MTILFIVCLIMIAANIILFGRNINLEENIEELQASNVVLFDRTEDLHYRVGIMEMAKEEIDTAEFDNIDEEDDCCKDGVCSIKF